MTLEEMCALALRSLAESERSETDLARELAEATVLLCEMFCLSPGQHTHACRRRCVLLERVGP